MSSSVNENNLEKKFLAVTNTQDSIQTLSLWILHHKTHHKKIVEIWMKVLSKAKINHRLTLFYLANDVIQNGKRKGYPQFGESFSDVLREATLLVRSEKIRSSIERVFNIWEQRNVYGSEFVSDLHAVLVNSKVPKSVPSKLISDFKHENVINKIRHVLKMESETSGKIAVLNVKKLNAPDAEILQQLKDRARGQRYSCDFEEATTCLEEVITSLESEVQQRTQLILLLEQSEIFYNSQRGEAKVVANAYKNFGAKVRALQRKLEDIKSSFPSPVPSPCPDAPSPTNSDLETELTLPCDRSQTLELASLDNAPSPVGSPEGLALTPPSSEKSDKQNGTGNPIPTLSNFFPQGPGFMSSWLDAFSSKTTPTLGSPKPLTPKTEPSSLDRRLSNFMQNIPNLSTGLQNTLFDVTKSGNSVVGKSTNSPLSYEKDENPTSMSTDAATPVKDECSGQNTPLQDEDNHSSNSAAFIGQQSLNSKTSQSPKDVLLGLTTLIQTASGVEKSNAYCTKPNISEFIKKIAPSLTQLSPISTASAPCSNSSQNSVASQPAKNVENSSLSVIGTSTDTTVTYPPVTYSNALASPHPAPSSSGRSVTKEVIENLSFIPTLVPSTPRDGLFNFASENFLSGEYNADIESYIPVDMDMESRGDVCLRDTLPSSSILSQGNLSHESALGNNGDAIKELHPQRQSTLITVVAKAKSQIPDHDAADSDNNIPHSAIQDHLPRDDTVKGHVGVKWHHEMLPSGNETNPFNVLDSDNDVLENISCADACKRQDLHLPQIMSAPEHELQNENDRSSISHNKSNNPGLETHWKQSKIETVQTHRNNTKDYRWFEKDWEGFQSQGPIGFHNSEQDYHSGYSPSDHDEHFQKRNVQHTNFHNRNWHQRDRPFINNRHQPYGSSHPKRFAPFSGRGGGWKNHHHQY